MKIDIKNIICFGFNSPKNKSWLTLLKKASTNGYNTLTDSEKISIEDQLSESIVKAYDNLVTIEFVDLDTEFKYVCKFDNIKKLWKLELPGSPDDAITDEDLKTFYEDKTFKDICLRSDKYLTDSDKICKQIVQPKVASGELLKINEIKFEAILDMLKDPSIHKNLKFGKHS